MNTSYWVRLFPKGSSPLQNGYNFFGNVIYLIQLKIDILQGSTLTLSRFPLESKFSSWKVKNENEPKYLPDLESKFWAMLESKCYF